MKYYLFRFQVVFAERREFCSEDYEAVFAERQEYCSEDYGADTLKFG